MKKNYLHFWKVCATLGPIGYFPASGTFATFFTLPIIWFVRNNISHEWHYALVTISVAIITYLCIHNAQKAFPGKQDPSSIVLDEVLGAFITFIAIPNDIRWFILGFILFRFFDIFKVCGISKCEKIKGAFGIILDDVAAALCSNILLLLVIHFF